MRFAVNPTFDSVKQWEGEYHADLLTANPLADGLFLDNTNGKLPIAGIAVQESTANYAVQTAATVAAVKAAIDDRIVVVNTTGAETNAAADGVTQGGRRRVRGVPAAADDRDLVTRQRHRHHCQPAADGQPDHTSRA